MKLKLLSMGLVLLMCGTALQTKGAEKVKTYVEKATLFLDGAQVTRTRQIDLPAGETTLAFTGLSPYLDAKSLQVTAKGRLTILSVERTWDDADSLEHSRLRQQLTEELKTAETKAKRTAAELENVQAEMNLLEVNCSAGARTANVPLATVKELTDYYAAQLGKLKTRQLELQEQQTQIEERRQQLSKELNLIGGSPKNPMCCTEVKVETKAPCKATFTLTYYVKNAGWYPCYDVRAAGLDALVALSYKANIYQNTGEEWKNVELTLSSANPTTGNVAPELRTYWLDYGLAAPRYDLQPRDNTVSGTVFDAENREPLIGATVAIPGTTIATATDIDGRYSITLPNGASQLKFSFVGMTPVVRRITGPTLNVMMRTDRQALDEVVVTGYGTQSKSRTTGNAKVLRAAISQSADFADFAEEESQSQTIAVERTQNQMGYEFAIQRPYTVPSDGKPVAVEIGRYELPAAYVYRSTPKIDKDAFLMAETTGSAKCNLLEGEASVYFEDTFVGKSVLSPDPANDTLRFSMGRDRGIVIKREKERDYTARRTMGPNRTQTVGWLLTVDNTRPETVTLVLCDQLPVSRNSDISVTAEELSGGQFDPTTGSVIWTLRLAPGEHRDLRLHYKVKYSKGRDLTVE